MNTTIKGDAMASSPIKLGPVTSRLFAAGMHLRESSGMTRVARPASLAGLLTLLSMNPAAAQAAGGTGNLTTFLTNVVNILTGTGGTALAVIAVGLCGVATMFGSISARTFGGVVLGVAISFSSAWVVGTINGGGNGG